MKTIEYRVTINRGKTKLFEIPPGASLFKHDSYLILFVLRRTGLFLKTKFFNTEFSYMP